MSEIGFYHLTRSRVDQALPQLLGRTLAVGQRALVVCGSAERLEALDKALWEAPDPEWLPHGTAADGDPDLQPIWLSTNASAVNGARFLFLTDGVPTPDLAAFDRVFDLFDGSDDSAVAAARARWKQAKQGGHALAYWQQGTRGWERNA